MKNPLLHIIWKIRRKNITGKKNQESLNPSIIRRIINIAPTNKLKRIMNSITYPLATDFSISAVCLSILC